MSGARIARPTFVAGPADDLIAADIYNKANGQVINSIQKLGDTLKLDDLARLRGGLEMQSQLPIITGIQGGKLVFDKDALNARLLATSGATGALRNLSDKMRDGVEGVIGDSLGGAKGLFKDARGMMSGLNGFADDAELEICGSIQKIRGAVVGTISDIAKSIHDLAGELHFNIIDTKALTAVYKGLLGELSNLGIKDAFGKLMHCFSDKPDLKKSLGKEMMTTAVETGDVQMLASISKELDNGAVPMVQPEAIANACSRYARPLNITAMDYVTEYAETMNAFGTVDPGWNAMTRQTSLQVETVLDITKLQRASPDLKSVLQAGSQSSADPDEQLYQLALLFPVTDVQTELTSSFPLTVVNPALRNQTQNMDPRALAFKTTEELLFKAPPIDLGRSTPNSMSQQDAIQDRVVARLGWNPADGGDKVLTSIWQKGEISDEEYYAIR